MKNKGKVKWVGYDGKSSYIYNYEVDEHLVKYLGIILQDIKMSGLLRRLTTLGKTLKKEFLF